MIEEIKINCKECLGDRHNTCLSEKCLCASNNHGVKILTLRDGVRVDFDKPISIDTPIDMELESITDGGLYTEVNRQDPTISAIKIIEYSIFEKKIIDKSEIFKIINSWQKRFVLNWNNKQISDLINNVWCDKETFGKIKLMAFQLGVDKKSIKLDRGQIHEVAEWLKGRYHIKRIDIDGKLLFFNDYFYESKAGELIRREARECLSISTKIDLNEVVSYIEDTCQLIKLDDIEKYIHLKCLLNGIYNIKTGDFSTKFNPNYIILNQIPHYYKENTSFENIDNAVGQIISDNKDKQTYYDFISTSLHPYTGIDFQFGGVGPGGTGKSQLCDLVVFTLGSENVSDASIHTIAKDHTTQMDIAYKMCNIDRDMSDSDIKETSVTKKWITQDRFRERSIYEHSGPFRPTARLMFMTNNLYEIANHEDAEAIYQRTYLARIENIFRGAEGEKKKIMEKVSTPQQLEGFITYLLKNATEIYQMQKIHFPMDSSKVKEIWNLHGNRIKEFGKKWFVKGTEFAVERTVVWDKWLGNALEKNFPPKGRDTFYVQFEEIMGTAPIQTTRNEISGRYYLGLRMLSNEEIALKEQEKLRDT